MGGQLWWVMSLERQVVSLGGWSALVGDEPWWVVGFSG